MRLLFLTDRSVADAVESSLKEDGLTVEVARSVEQAEARLKARACDVLLVDQNRLKKSLCAALSRWRKEGGSVLLVVLLARSSGSEERAAFLEAGADACLQAPLSPEELKAHLRALKRRHQGHMPTQRIHDLMIHTAGRRVLRAGQPIHLTPREFDLLLLLASHPGKVFSRSTIIEHLYDVVEENSSNVVDVFVSYLRSKIDKGFDLPLILTCRGRGYLFRAEET